MKWLPSQQVSNGFYRVRDIIGQPQATPPKPALIPISRSKLYADIRAGRFPKPIKLGKRCIVWPVDVVHAHMERLIAHSYDSEAKCSGERLLNYGDSESR